MFLALKVILECRKIWVKIVRIYKKEKEISRASLPARPFAFLTRHYRGHTRVWALYAQIGSTEKGPLGIWTDVINNTPL